MSSLILVPSRGRPESAYRLHQEYIKTWGQGDMMDFIVSKDDPTLEEYMRLVPVIAVEPTGCMSWDVNKGLDYYKRPTFLRQFTHVGFMGDDHSLKSDDWSRLVEDAGFGIIYGPDGSDNLARELPTFWFVSTPIVEALGWISPPYMRHFYLDDAWREIGKESGTLKYVPELYIEHLHFSFGKSDKDETYEHTMRVGGLDSMMYSRYMVSTQFEQDVEKVKAVIP